MKHIARRILPIALATSGITVGAVGAASASAPGGNETCPSQAFCVYYNSWQYGWGSFAVYYTNEIIATTFDFTGNGNGYNDPVKDNAAAIVNNTTVNWQMCTADFNHCETYTPGEAGNVSTSIHNLDASVGDAATTLFL